jgi:hypothetical protein
VNFFAQFCDHPNRDLELIGDTFVENSPKFGQKLWPKLKLKSVWRCGQIFSKENEFCLNFFGFPLKEENLC